MNGVVATKAGWIGKVEVVEVSFDPKVISREELEKRGRGGCVTEAFEPGSAIRLVEDQKYYLTQTVLRHVPMTAAQAARVHATTVTGEAEQWLSPAQRAAAALVRAAPDAEWPNLVGVSLTDAWEKFHKRAAALAAATSANSGE